MMPTNSTSIPDHTVAYLTVVLDSVWTEFVPGLQEQTTYEKSFRSHGTHAESRPEVNLWGT